MPSLPGDLLVLIVDYYLARRREELLARAEWPYTTNDRRFRSRRPDSGPTEAEWPVIPILQSNRDLHDLVVGSLYGRCLLIKKLAFEKFFMDPALSKYALVKELDMRTEEDSERTWPSLNDRVTLMFNTHLAEIVK